MRHYKKGRKLGTSASHTRAMKKSLVSALFLNDRIKTVDARAKEIRGNVDKIITWAKRGDLHARRLAIAALGDKELVREIFEKVEQGMFKDRNGGYTRIMKLGTRKGDNAPMVIMELVTEPVASAKKAGDKPSPKKAAPKKAAPKKAAEGAKAADAAEGAAKAAEGAADEQPADEPAKDAQPAAEPAKAAQPAAEPAKAAKQADAKAPGKKAEAKAKAEAPAKKKPAAKDAGPKEAAKPAKAAEDKADQAKGTED